MTTTTIRLDTPRPVLHTAGGARAVVFDEGESVPAALRWFGLMLAVAGLALTAAIVAWPDSAPEVALIIPALAAIACGALLATARTGLTVRSDALVLRFRPFPSRRIQLPSIVSVRVVDCAEGGRVHLAPSGRREHRHLMLSTGSGVEITDDRGRTTFVRVTHPEDAVRALIHASGE